MIDDASGRVPAALAAIQRDTAACGFDLASGLMILVRSGAA